MKPRSPIKISFLICYILFVGSSAFFFSCKKTGAPKNVWFTLDISSSANNSVEFVGGYIYNSNLIIIRTNSASASSSFAVFYELCPNDGATVTYNYTLPPPPGFLVCPKCGSRFDVNGNVAFGPSKSPLTSYNVSLSGTVLTISSK